MNKLNNILIFKNSYIKDEINKIEQVAVNWNYSLIHTFFKKEYNIDSAIESDIINPYTRDWSNLPGGQADLLVRPSTSKQCAIILRVCKACKIPITISAGQTNLTGSATPNGGIIVSTSMLKNPKINVDISNQCVSSPVGVPLEMMREEVLNQTQNSLYYPVDPTSRHEAYVGGTISCNASGFIPGIKGATRYWVQEIELLLLNGYVITIKRGEYKSINNKFIVKCDEEEIILPIPTYKRPDIKNASGPFSAYNDDIDFIDLIIGSEGIFGMITRCTFALDKKPQNHLELFIRLENEEKAILFYHYLYDFFDHDMSKITALEYFGFNCQTYMKHKDFFFRSKTEVGLYLQVPIYNGTIDDMTVKWVDILNKFNKSIDLESIIILNDSLIWKKFFEARHSIPDNALTKTRQLGGISIITDTIVPPENFKIYLQKIHNRLQKENIEYLLFGHLGDCHLHFHLIPNNKQKQQCMEVYDYMIDLSAELGGVYSAEHGTGKRKRNDFKKCYGKDAIEMVKQSKLSLDPHLLLNKGNVFN